MMDEMDGEKDLSAGEVVQTDQGRKSHGDEWPD